MLEENEPFGSEVEEDVLPIDLTHEWPTSRSRVQFNCTQNFGLSITRGNTSTRLGIFSTAPAGTPAAAASAMLQASVAAVISAVGIAGIAKMAGAGAAITLTMGTLTFVVIVLIVFYVIVRESPRNGSGT